MTLEALISLRDDADRLIRSQASAQKQTLENQLARISSYVGGRSEGKGRERRGSLKGRKVAPKYRNPANKSETWAGRGVRPRWLQTALRNGHKIEEFAIAKPGSHAGTKKRRGGSRKKVASRRQSPVAVAA